jgi:hypothetical protein
MDVTWRFEECGLGESLGFLVTVEVEVDVNIHAGLVVVGLCEDASADSD